jgi:hypothetical protein
VKVGLQNSTPKVPSLQFQFCETQQLTKIWLYGVNNRIEHWNIATLEIESAYQPMLKVVIQQNPRKWCQKYSVIGSQVNSVIEWRQIMKNRGDIFKRFDCLIDQKWKETGREKSSRNLSDVRTNPIHRHHSVKCSTQPK